MFGVDSLSFSHILIILGLIFIAIEILVLGFGTIVLLFLGLSLVEVGILSHFIYPALHQSIGSTAGVLILVFTLMNTGVLTYFLWKPLKRFQSARSYKQENSSDFIGHTFILDETLSSEHIVHYKLSGIQWRLYLADTVSGTIKQGTQVKVVQVSAGKLWIAPV